MQEDGGVGGKRASEEEHPLEDGESQYQLELVSWSAHDRRSILVAGEGRHQSYCPSMNFVLQEFWPSAFVQRGVHFESLQKKRCACAAKAFLACLHLLVRLLGPGLCLLVPLPVRLLEPGLPVRLLGPGLFACPAS